MGKAGCALQRYPFVKHCAVNVPNRNFVHKYSTLILENFLEQRICLSAIRHLTPIRILETGVLPDENTDVFYHRYTEDRKLAQMLHRAFHPFRVWSNLFRGGVGT